MIDLSIIPLYRCNMNCSFCYLGDKRQDTTVLNLDMLKDLLSKHQIRDIDIYGGEISLLDDDYICKLMEAIGNKRITLVTNSIGFTLSKWLSYISNDNIDVSFSYDKIRENQNLIKQNILNFDKFEKPYSIICVDISDLDYDFLMSCKNLKSLSIKPYSKSIYNKKDFHENMQTIYKTLHDKYSILFDKLEMVTEYRDQIEHFFMLPDGKLYDIRYKDNIEYFCCLDNCKSILDNKCLCCKYYRKCFNEHYYSYVPNDECIGRIKTMEYLDGLYDIH